ncbi:hypothetical protein CIL03_08385 [Virgibacillus indicus]|uniref:Inhibitor of sigma-G Gin n=1 Tax=Virgibacillus indicus TaxID=2024554 RepID=A0A265NB62_9BACI|nr:hypothetical protein [Virgibacillus indicus]OZU89025.1 hypothetical protein CIL03_08385 [Virgibacillus indicus]
MTYYSNCSICKNVVDDGGLKNNQFVCHDCLDWVNEMEEIIIENMEKLKTNETSNALDHTEVIKNG